MRAAETAMAPRLAGLLDTMYYTGGRVAEICALQWQSIIGDPETGYSIHFRGNTTKGGLPRIVPVPLFYAARMLAYPRRTLGPQTFIFSSAIARPFETCRPPITTRTAQNLITRTARAKGIRHYTPHNYRHTYATNLLAVTNVKIVQLLLGHRSMATTQLYLHPPLEQLREAVLNAFLTAE